MRYILVILVWLPLSALWGLVGGLIGPGIVMLIIALMVGTMGSLITVIKLLCGYDAYTISTGLLVAAVSILLTGVWIVDARMTWPGTLFFTAFISALSFVASFLVSRVLIHR